jgi:hypothetical protein
VSATASALAKDGERDPSQLCDRAVMLDVEMSRARCLGPDAIQAPPTPG